ncbi:MAG TPA: hypothetical protein VF194_02715, partial [Ferrovibrio sp.]|uniref:hypothetical protein n=1 Tax=Ferrovibrio sp. TaxID=1917215 RepID=UPI002ED012C0
KARHSRYSSAPHAAGAAELNKSAGNHGVKHGELTMSEYTEAAEKFLADHGLQFRAVYVSSACPRWCEDAKHIHGDRYRCTISGKGRGRISFDFWNSYNDSRAGKAPTAYDLLAAIQKYDPESFETFCSEYGYSTDSRKALSAYRAVAREWRKVAAFFTETELKQIREIN